MIYLFAIIGVINTVVFISKATRQIVKDARSKPTPWLGIPVYRGPS